MDQATKESGPRPLTKLPMRLHHHAYTTDDHERNRQFYEDVLGLPLTAMYVEREFLEGEWVELGHAFYSLGDGSALAFFNMADPAKQAAMRAKEQSIFVHISFLVDQSTQDDIKSRLTDAGLSPFVLDHGFCVSLYVKDPNGLLLEFTVDHADAAGIAAEMAATAHADMRRWMNGDRAVNNRWRPAGTPD
ncbi:MAG TPA: VOC family protein [Rhodopila sp.]|jgi:catechol 2,3-dioxygenase-like lactoylglutathione lyase family enzyme